MNFKQQLYTERVNSFIGCAFLGSFALGASLIIWNSAFGYNPVARALENHYAPIVMELQQPSL